MTYRTQFIEFCFEQLFFIFFFFFRNAIVEFNFEYLTHWRTYFVLYDKLFEKNTILTN